MMNILNQLLSPSSALRYVQLEPTWASMFKHATLAHIAATLVLGTASIGVQAADKARHMPRRLASAFSADT